MVGDVGRDSSGGPLPLASLDGSSVWTWSRLVAVRLEAARAELDALNVFPVPDGDTGTNLARSVRAALDDPGADPVQALLVHARGSSGVIASQLLRGWADVIGHRMHGAGEAITAAMVAAALRRGDDLAWAAVADPVEGTVLSVSRAAAAAADEVAATDAPLHEVVRASVQAAAAALALTPTQLPALAAAGVVDAGGAALLLVLRALADVVDSGEGATPLADSAGPLAASAAGPRGADLDPDGPGYEVMYLLAADTTDDTTDDTAADAGDGAVGSVGDRLRAALHRLGDSVVVVGGPGLWHVHVHTDEPGAAVEAGLVEGRPRAIRITHFAAGVRGAAQESTPVTPRGESQRGLAVVACAAGEATVRLCRDAGAVVVTSGPGERASAGEVLTAVLGAGRTAGRVLLLPNDAESAVVAGRAALAAREHGVPVVVGRSRSQVQVLAALAVTGAGAGTDDAALLRSAADAVLACRHGAVAVAARPMSTPLGSCRVGHVIGTVDREVVAVGPTAEAVAERVVDHLLTDPAGAQTELLTLVPGRDADATLLVHLCTRLAAARPQLRVDVVGGGQTRYLLLVGCE